MVSLEDFSWLRMRLKLKNLVVIHFGEGVMWNPPPNPNGHTRVTVGESGKRRKTPQIKLVSFDTTSQLWQNLQNIMI